MRGEYDTEIHSNLEAEKFVDALREFAFQAAFTADEFAKRFGRVVKEYTVKGVTGDCFRNTLRTALGGQAFGAFLVAMEDITKVMSRLMHYAAFDVVALPKIQFVNSEHPFGVEVYYEGDMFMSGLLACIR